MEPFYPLQVFVCGKCFLVQLREFVAPENIFSDYLYFASYSDTWLAHAKRYTDEMVRRFPISEASLVIEIASNDGYLLQYFAEKNIPVLGVEPAANVAQVAAKKGISSITKFFSRETAKELVAAGKRADLLLVELSLRVQLERTAPGEEDQTGGKRNVPHVDLRFFRTRSAHDQAMITEFDISEQEDWVYQQRKKIEDKFREKQAGPASRLSPLPF